MVNVDLIKQKLPQDLWEIAQQYTIPDTFLEGSSDLIILVLYSKSIDTLEEKQSWFNLLPLMTADQIAKFRDILTREKQKLQEIEQKYEQKKSDIKAQYAQKWQDGAYKDKMIQLQQHEQVHQNQEEQEADNLLTQI